MNAPHDCVLPVASGGSVEIRYNPGNVTVLCIVHTPEAQTTRVRTAAFALDRQQAMGIARALQAAAERMPVDDDTNTNEGDVR